MGILEIIIVLFVLMWLFGIGFSIGGGFIHILLIIAIILIVYRLASGERL